MCQHRKHYNGREVEPTHFEVSATIHIQWFNKCREVKVNKKVLITFSIGKYEDEVLCDVAPIQTCHVLLGRPWQFIHRPKYNGHTNRYSFEFQKTITLASLMSQQILKDQTKLKASEERKESENVKTQEFEKKKKENEKDEKLKEKSSKREVEKEKKKEKSKRK